MIPSLYIAGCLAHCSVTKQCIAPKLSDSESLVIFIESEMRRRIRQPRDPASQRIDYCTLSRFLEIGFNIILRVNSKSPEASEESVRLKNLYPIHTGTYSKHKPTSLRDKILAPMMFRTPSLSRDL